MTSKKLRIAVWHNLPSGGGKRALWGHVSGLLKRGHQIEVWRPPMADDKYLPLADLCPEHVVPLELPPLKKSLPLLGWLMDCRALMKQVQAMQAHAAVCAKQMRAGNFDVVLANSCAVFAVPPLARYLGDLPSALYLGEPNRRLYEAALHARWSAPDTGLAGVMIDALKSAMYRIQMREEIANARAFNRVLVNSYFSRESVLRAYALESGVCYLGIDTDFFRPTGEPVEKFLLGFGSMHFHKGADRAVEALGRVRADLRPKLLWVGNTADETYVADVRRRAQELGVDFEMRVMVTDAELISLLSRAAAVLYTSRLEPFGLAPLEANACGTPVIGIAEGGVRESIVDGENGLLMPDASPRGMAMVLEKFLSEPKLAIQLREKCRSTVLTRWNTEAGIDRLETALFDIIRETRARSN